MPRLPSQRGTFDVFGGSRARRAWIETDTRHWCEAVNLRLKLCAHLCQLITKIEVFASGDSNDDHYEVMEARALEYYPDALDDPCFVGFMEHVAQQRQTKLGRFLRVHYRGGAVVDLVPPGSLASGMELVHDGRKRDGWRFVSPKLDRRYREWKTEHSKQE